MVPATAFALEEKRIANMFNPLATPADEVVKISILTFFDLRRHLCHCGWPARLYDFQVPSQARR